MTTNRGHVCYRCRNVKEPLVHGWGGGGGGEGAECLVLWLTVCLQVFQHEEPMAEDKHPGKMQQKLQYFKDYLQTVAA